MESTQRTSSGGSAGEMSRLTTTGSSVDVDERGTVDGSGLIGSKRPFLPPIPRRWTKRGVNCGRSTAAKRTSRSRSPRRLDEPLRRLVQAADEYFNFRP